MNDLFPKSGKWTFRFRFNIFAKILLVTKNNNLDFTTVKQLKYIYAFEQFPMPAIYNNLFTN